MVSPCHVVSSVSAWIFPQITCCYFCSSFSHAASGGWVNWKLVGGAGNGNLPCHVGTPQLLLYRLLQLRSLDDTIIFVLFLDGLVKIKAACVFLYFSLVLNAPSQHYWFPVKKYSVVVRINGMCPLLWSHEILEKQEICDYEMACIPPKSTQKVIESQSDKANSVLGNVSLSHIVIQAGTSMKLG